MENLTIEQVKRLDELKGLSNSIVLMIDDCKKTLNDSLCSFFSDEYEKADILLHRLQNQRNELRHEMFTLMGL